MFWQPAVLHALLEHLTQALIVYVCHQIDCGAQVLALHVLPRRALAVPPPSAQSTVKSEGRA